MTFHDLHDRVNASDHDDHSPPPPPQVVRHTHTPPAEVSKFFLQPIQPRTEPHMHFFHQPYHVEPPVIESRRMSFGGGGGGFGGASFIGGGGFGVIPTIVLDPVWHGLAEQLGF